MRTSRLLKFTGIAALAAVASLAITTGQARAAWPALNSAVIAAAHAPDHVSPSSTGPS